MNLQDKVVIVTGARGINVSLLCPQAVNTPMLNAGDDLGVEDGGVAGLDGIIEPEALCDYVIEGLAAEAFLILPHPVVRKYMQNKTADYNRWIQGMMRLKEQGIKA